MANERRDSLWALQKNTFTMFMAETLGTAMLIFIGCMGCIGSMGPSPPPPLQTALAFGLTVNLIIMMLGHVSGAHLNPAITICAVLTGLKSISTAAMYILAQFVGATIGYGTLKIVTPFVLMNDGRSDSTSGLCVTTIHPEISIVQAILIETLCTAFIVSAACATWDARCARNADSVAIKFGLSVTVVGLAAGPYTGCSINPARSFGPAFWNNEWENQWVYWVGPTFGALLGTYTYQVLFNKSDESVSNSHAESVTETKPFDVLLYSKEDAL